MMFVVQGIMLTMFGGAYFSYSFLADPGADSRRESGAEPADRFRLSRWCSALALYLALTRTRIGTAIRAVAVDPVGGAAGGDRCRQGIGAGLCARRRAGGGCRRA